MNHEMLWPARTPHLPLFGGEPTFMVSNPRIITALIQKKDLDEADFNAAW